MKETILLIEDEVELQQNLKEILEFNGFTVFTADNGQDALMKIEDQEVDLIICDVMMPVLGGFQFLKIIRNQEKYQHTPFIFLSAKASKEDKFKGLFEGSDDYLTKPIPARVLLNSIFKVLEGKKQKEFLSYDTKDSGWVEDNSPIELGINSPVNYLISILELLKKTEDSTDRKEISRLLDLAMSSAKRIHSSFGNLPLFKNLAKLSPTPLPIFLNDLVLDMINEMGPDKFLFRSGPPENPFFDSDHIKFILRELMENALKFNQNFHPVEIEWFGKELSFKNKQSVYKFGDAIPMEPFFQPNGDLHGCNGLGLGLFLVKEFCKINQAEFHCLIDSKANFIAKILFKISSIPSVD